MGDTAGPTVFEDQRLGKSMDAGDLTEFREGIAALNEKYPVWGWKRPTSYRRIQGLEGEFRFPYYVAVFRDPVAVGLRESISMGFDPTKIMTQTLDAYRSIMNLMNNTGQPFLALSYEKALRYPRHFVEELARFAGRDDEGSIQAALSFIDPEPHYYLQRSHRRKDL